MSIRGKLTLLFLAAGLVPALLISAFAYASVSNELTAKTEEQIEGIAAKQEQRLSALIQSKQEETVRLANAQFDLSDALGSYLRTSKQQDLDVILDMFRDRKFEVPQIHAIYLTDESGAIIATTASSDAGKSLTTDDVFLSPTQPSTVRLREDKNDGINKLYVTARVTVDKQTSAILLVIYRLNDIIATVEDYTGLGATGETVVASENEDGSITSLFALRFDTQAALVAKVDGLHMLKDDQAVYSDGIDYRGKEVIVATGLIEGPNWGIATKIDKDEALAPILGLRNVIIIIFVASLAVIVGSSLYFTRYFAAPIITLTDKTRRILQGDFTQRVEVKSKDEIGTLSATFNEMTNRLNEFYRGLEQKVKERTQSLDQKVQELGAAKAKTEAILDSVGEGLVATDNRGTILFLNQIAANLLGIDHATAMGKSVGLINIYSEDDKLLPPAYRPLEMSLQTGRRTEADIKTHVAGDAKLLVGAIATPVIQNKVVIGAIQVMRDRTKEKEVDRMKTEFISLASHQLRTPLSAIRWFTEMLINGDAGKLNTEQQEFAKSVYESTDRMIQLVGSLLNISRIESGRIIIDPKPTDLKQLVQGIVTDLNAKIVERQQTLLVNVHPDLPLVNLDPHLIGQVYLNFLTNAIKYTPKGGEISVFVSRKGEELISQVSDNGYGVPVAQQSRLFQKFFRAENIVKVETDGTGLGLYLVKAIIESSGGRVWFNSVEGKGTTFWFSLPISGMKAKAGEVTLDQ